ncbi:MAG TPA: AAA family ATPase [Jatrophihabitantaceae bacterium]|nr:AAA family ATPase [Jatrophihabitantaceae bacterium]
MLSSDPGQALRGRRSECNTLDHLLADARTGHSRVLVLRGEAGIGKTALLEYLLGSASGYRTARSAGIESEMELAYAGLHQLCAPFSDRHERLPGPQRAALETAFGLRQGEPPDRFLVGLAVLTLLAEVAEEQPLLCLVDDAQWLDRVSAQTVAFVARRLLAERIALVIAVREPSGETDVVGLPDLTVRGLSDHDARAMLLDALHVPLDAAVCDRIIAECRGNPLALLELPRTWPAAELAGGFGTPDTQPLASRIEAGYVRRLRSLPGDTQLLLLAAAADPVGDAALLWRAAGRLGLGADPAAAAEKTGLIEFGPRIRFRHPLVRSAVYRSALPSDRRAVHLALAEATDPIVDPDRRAWHLAAAAPEPDEQVAVELERSAGRAQARGGLAAAAAFLQRAVALTDDSARRTERALAAAQANLHAGAFDAALGLLTAAHASPLDELQRARVDLLRGQIAFASGHGSDAPPLLLEAAKQLEPLDPDLARETYLDAWGAALFAGRLATAGSLLDAASAARSAPSPRHRPRPSDVLLDALAMLITEGHIAAAPKLRQATRAFAGEADHNFRWGWLTTVPPNVLWDDESWHAINVRQLQVARKAGALARLPIDLTASAILAAWWGDFAMAAAVIGETDAVTEATQTRIAPYGAMLLAALRGREASALIDSAIDAAIAGGQGIAVQYAHWVRAILFNGLGRYDRALAAAQQASADTPELFLSAWALPELIEASVRSGHSHLGLAALERLVTATSSGGTDWALGIEARSRALLSEGDTAESLYREATQRLACTRFRPELARAHLLYGEWLRREGRRVDARQQLRIAHDILGAIGMDAFAERARRELLATGETARKRTVETPDELTAQETQIARLAREGLSNHEIGTRLFISPRTVEWHLRKVFTKLGISSRKQLRDSGLNAAPA